MFVFSIAIINENVEKDKGNEWSENEGHTPFAVITSIGNHGKDQDDYTLNKLIFQLVYSVVMIVLIIIGNIFLRFYQKEIDERNTTASKYCLYVTGISKSKSKAEVQHYFQKFDEDLDIVYVNYCYDIRDIVKEVRRQTRLKLEKAYILSEMK